MSGAPDSSAVRTALWRALHVQVDPPPHLIDDEIGLAVAAPPDGWRQRGDMHPAGTGPYRIGIVARTRFVEDLVVDGHFRQYVLLGAGLDTFARRHKPVPGGPPPVQVFEIDAPGPQTWKRDRLVALGGVADHLHFVSVDFETGGDWWRLLASAGFDPTVPAVASSSGVSMYITKDATAATLRQLAAMAPGSVAVMTFMLPLDLADPAERRGLEGAAEGARASGTPWISYFTPDEMAALATEAGFATVECVSTAELADRYLAGRSDLPRASGGEGVLLART